jgi:DNA-binding IscR family transcriptional regulator
MQIGTKFSIAIHILLCVEYFKETNKITGDFIAASAKTNPTIIRNIMALLKEANIIEITPGSGGTKLLRTPDNITMLDIYNAVNPVKDSKLFKIHNPESRCPVGGRFESILSPVFSSAQDAMENDLKKQTLKELLIKLT